MFHKQLANHISVRMQSGATTEEVTEELRKDGWSEADIREAFYYAMNPAKLTGLSARRTLKSEISAITAGAIFLVLVAVGFLGFHFFGQKIYNYSIDLPPMPGQEATKFTYGEVPALSNPDFFADTKKRFLEEKASFVEANLSQMTLRVYRDGDLKVEVPINSKGKDGSWWETPAGLYKVLSKERAHFSSMGHVWMPWSLNFQGNFFIHGRTYYPDGSPTSKEFTGGCIRLATSDAEKVYEASDVGMPVLVFEESFSPDNFTYESAPVSLAAGEYLSGDLRNNHIFTDKDADKPVPIASLTKLMTALIATEYINLDNIATVPKEAIATTSKPRLKEGMKLSVYQLLFPLLLESSNEAAEAIARYYGRDEFIRRMNQKAASIGMQKTTFADPSGVSSGNVSSAEDLFMLAKYIYNNRSFIFKITSGQLKDSAYGEVQFKDIGNLNDFVGSDYWVGGKNGKSTSAKETSLSVFDFPVSSGKRPIVLIVLGADDRKAAAQSLLVYTSGLLH